MTAAGQLLVRQHQLTQIRNGGLAAALVMQLGEDLLRGKISRDEFVAGIVAQGRLSHGAAVRLAKQFLTEYHQIEAPHMEHLEPPLLAADDGAALGKAVGTLRDLDTLDRKARNYDDEFIKIVGGLAVRQHQTTLDAGRDVVVLSAAANDRRWRRVTDGNPCAFCAMLATRTDYTSPFAAQYVVGRGKTTRLGARGRRGLGVRPRGSRSLGEKYHDNCGCTVAEVFDDWEPSHAERQQKALYEEARKACDEKGLEPNLKNILAQMRELGDGTVHDAHVPEGEKKKPGRKPKTQTGGSSGGGRKPPRRGAGAFKDMPEPPRSPDDGGSRSEWLRYWKERQDALPLDFKGDIIEPHEVLSFERLLRRGELVDPIRNLLDRPTADFDWPSIGAEEVEMKAPAPRSATMMNAIEKAVRKARKHKIHPMAKEHFLLDLGDDELTEELAKEMANCNRTYPHSQIKRLWVMSSNGSRLTEIQLAT